MVGDDFIFKHNGKYTVNPSAKCIRELTNHQSNLSNLNQRINQPPASSLQPIASGRIVTHNELFCLPIFWVTKILLKQIQVQILPIVIQVKFIKNNSEKHCVLNDEEVLLYRLNKNDSNNYSVTEVYEVDLEETACFFQGIVCSLENQQPLSKEEWKKTIGQYSIIDVILANIAYHRQYPNPNKEVPILDQEYENYKCLAKNCGFSIDNPTLLLFQHVYAAKIKTSPKLFERAMKDKSERQ